MRGLPLIRHRLPTSLSLVVMLATAMALSPARAQRDSARARRPQPAAVDTAPGGSPVVFGVDTLFRLYGTLGPFSPDARAAAAAERLREAARALAQGDSVVVADHESSSDISVGELMLMTVLDADARPLGVPRATLARRYAAQVRVTVGAAGRRMSTRALAIDAAFALLATVVLLLLLRLLSYAFPKLYARIEAVRGARLRAIRIQEFELLSAGRLSALLVGTARVLRVVLTVVLFYFYVPLVLSFFPWTAALSQRIIGYALRPFAVAWLGFVGYLPNLFYLAAGIIIVRYLLAFLHLLFGAVETGAINIRGFYAEWAEPTYKIARVVVLAFAATVMYPYLPGARSDAFKGVSIFLGVLFSLGSSAAIGNMVAGVVLTYTRAFQVGDRVKIGETVGDVVEKTLLVTRLRTIKNVAVTIPNGTVLSSQVVNYATLAASHGLILHTAVTIGYGAPWRQVHELLIEAGRCTEHVLADPPPFVLQTSLDDFYVSYELNVTTDRPDLMAVTYSRLHQNIQERFNAGGVEIMSPHYGALRDGNATTIPPHHLATDYRAPAFRVETTHAGHDGASLEPPAPPHRG